MTVMRHLVLQGHVFQFGDDVYLREDVDLEYFGTDEDFANASHVVRRGTEVEITNTSFSDGVKVYTVKVGEMSVRGIPEYLLSSVEVE